MRFFSVLSYKSLFLYIKIHKGETKKSNVNIGQCLKSFHQCSQIQSLNEMGAFRAFSCIEFLMCIEM